MIQKDLGTTHRHHRSNHSCNVVFCSGSGASFGVDNDRVKVCIAVMAEGTGNSVSRHDSGK